MKKTDILFVAAVVIICATFLSVIVTLNKIKTITGYASSTGTANLTVETAAAINFTTSVINWGSGRVTEGQTSATLDTAAGTVTNGNWTVVSQGLVLENIGNVNLTLDLAASQSAANFIGGTSPDYEWNITNSEALSCTNVTGIDLGLYWNTNATASICSIFQYLNDRDAIRIDIKLVVPYDSKTGALADVITATATTA